MPALERNGGCRKTYGMIWFHLGEVLWNIFVTMMTGKQTLTLHESEKNTLIYLMTLQH